MNTARQLPEAKRRPADTGRISAHAATIAAACRRIETSETPPNLDALAKAAGMSRFHFHRTFKALAGLTPKAYATQHRGARVRTALAKRTAVTEAIYGSGYNSNGRFYAESENSWV